MNKFSEMNPVPRDKPPGRLKNWKAIFIHWKILCFLSITGISIFNTLLYVSVQTTTAINASLITSIVYFALFPSLVTYFCWNKGVELIGANRAGLFINLIPVFASFMAVAWLQESLKLFHFAGLLLVFVGMVLFNRKIYDAD